jgi:hypothetical protein
VFDAVLTPGEVVLLLSWRDQTAADALFAVGARDKSTRLRQVRVVRATMACTIGEKRRKSMPR